MSEQPSGQQCPACRAPAPEGSRFCGRCGADLSAPDLEITRTQFEVKADLSDHDTSPGEEGLDSDTPTDPAAGRRAVPPSAMPTRQRRTSTPTPSEALGESRFLPGTIIADRYRIFGLLGRGGMGEVYRADDLKLGQPVALKFLPEELARDEDRLNRFLNEVRTARQVAHPNVCRVYDVGEVEDHHYISMEYVDGEDLASLLRRIGRLPEDKAVQIARQLCAGVAAAHEQGILHRDLKPANVMIDGRGGVRITDFGLAALTDRVEGAAAREGTPSYMAPEQIRGEQATFQSDVYALGLVLYELFTGKRAFKAKTAAEMSSLQTDTSAITSPSTVISGLDPAVERTILRCLEPDPGDRPRGALTVAASLPGGDPLAAALAAGETPSPELVAAAGEGRGSAPTRTLGVAALAVAIFFLAAWMNGRVQLRAYIPNEKPPAAMVDRAREVIRELGYTEPVYADPYDSAFGYSLWPGKLNTIAERDRSDDRWEQIRDADAGIMHFWYRQQPRLMLTQPNDATFAGGPVQRWDPWPSTTGGVLVSLDAAGRLRFFAHTPRRFHLDPLPDEPYPWEKVFELARLDMDRFTPVEPRYQRFMSLDQRAAWTGSLPGYPEDEVRIEMGTRDGRLTLFAINERWELDNLVGEPGNLSPQRAWIQTVLTLVMVGLIVGAAAVARHNVRVGRADRRGAGRVTALTLVLTLAYETLRSHGLFDPLGVGQVFPILGTATFYGAVILVLYLALEPYARRVWPAMLVSWTRLVGRERIGWRDPLVGRSVLAGALAGAILGMMVPLGHAVHSMVEGAPAAPYLGSWSILYGPRFALAQVIDTFRDGITEAAMLAFVLVIGRMVFRRTTPAVMMAVVVWLLLGGINAGVPLPHVAVELVFDVIQAVVLILMVVRFGLLAGMVAITVTDLALMAAAVDWGAWHARPSWLAVAVAVAIAGYGYWSATAERRLLGDEPVPARRIPA